jgi:hypothetical protein
MSLAGMYLRGFTPAEYHITGSEFSGCFLGMVQFNKPNLCILFVWVNFYSNDFNTHLYLFKIMNVQIGMVHNHKSL